MPNWTALQRTVGKIIQDFGTTDAALRRSNVDRAIKLVNVGMTSQERRGDMFQWTDQRVLVRADGLDTPPDNELDTLIMASVEYKIVKPPVAIVPDAVTAMYWELIIRATDR